MNKSNLRLRIDGLWCSGSRGTALVELVLVTPMLLLLMMGAIEVGRYADFALKVANAARAGAQYGSLNTANAGYAQGVTDAAKIDALGAPGSTVVYSGEYCVCSSAITTPVTCTQGGSGCSTSSDATNHQIYYVAVTVTGSFATLTNTTLLPSSLIGPLTLSSTATMQVAQ